MISLPMSEDKFAGYLKKMKPDYHTAVTEYNNLKKWIAELDGRLPRRDETLSEAANFINSFDRKAKAKDKGYAFFGMPDEELDVLKSLLEAEHNKMSNSDEPYGPTGIANPADYIQFDGSSFDDDDYEDPDGEPDWKEDNRRWQEEEAQREAERLAEQEEEADARWNAHMWAKEHPDEAEMADKFIKSRLG